MRAAAYAAGLAIVVLAALVLGIVTLAVHAVAWATGW